MSNDKRSFSSQIGNTDLRILGIFKTVVESGGFAAAEVTLNIGRSAISIAISDLEKRLGLSLCQRGRAGFVLTDEGKAVYESVLQLLASLETFRAQVNTLHEQLSGDLNIGIADNLVTMEHMNISRSLAQLKARGPDVRIRLRMTTPADIETGVLDGSLHVGVVPSIRRLPAIEYRWLYDEISYLYCSSDHPLFNEENLSQHAVYAFDMVTSSYAQSSEVRELEREFNDTAEASDREGVAFLILTGSYIGFLPTHYARQWVDTGRLKPLFPDRLCYRTEFAAITRRGARPNRIVQTFMDALADNPQTA